MYYTIRHIRSLQGVYKTSSNLPRGPGSSSGGGASPRLQAAKGSRPGRHLAAMASGARKMRLNVVAVDSKQMELGRMLHVVCSGGSARFQDW